MISINGKKKEKKKNKEKEEEAAADDEGVIGDCVGNLLAATWTGHSSCFIVFFFFLFFFFFFPYKFLCSRSEIIRSPSELYSSSCSFISSRSDHNFIPVYWPKFTGKAETKKKPFEPQKPVTVHKTGGSDRGPCGSLLFWHGTVLHPKQTEKLNGSRFFRSDRTVRSGFQNITQ